MIVFLSVKLGSLSPNQNHRVIVRIQSANTAPGMEVYPVGVPFPPWPFFPELKED